MLAFSVPVYGGLCSVHLTPEDFNKYRFDRFGGAPITRPACGRTSKISHADSSVEYVVGWFDGKVSTLAHEMAHVAIFALTRAGINVAGEDGEPFCHLLDSLMQLAGADE